MAKRKKVQKDKNNDLQSIHIKLKIAKHKISNWNLQFLNNVIFNKTKVLLPQAYVILVDFCDPV